MRTKELTLEITDKCYQNCPWCSSNSSPDGEHVNDRIFSFLKGYSGECNVVRFSGGEPTLHPKLPSFMEYSKELGYKIVLMTNGLHMTNLSSKICDYVDEYVVNIVNGHSIVEVLTLWSMKQKLSMQVVLVRGMRSGSEGPLILAFYIIYLSDCLLCKGKVVVKIVNPWI